jgi:hypothetical protein
MIRIDTIQQDDLIMQQLTLLYLLKIGVSVQVNEGQHFGLNFGIGPLELSFVVRLWNGTQK